MSGIMLAVAGTGGTGALITLTDQTYTVSTGGASAATVSYRLSTNGFAYDQDSTSLEQWCDPAAQAPNYEVLATIVSGTLTSGTTGSWLALTSDRTWSKTVSPPSIGTCVFTVEVRRIGTTTVLDSATISITADAVP